MAESESERPRTELPDAERAGDALRNAVERTLAATAGSASETRQRARSLLDEVARRGEEARDELTRRGEEARDELTRRGEEARDELGRRGEAAREQVTRRRDAARDDLVRRGEEAASRLSEAIAELNLADREDLGPIADRIAAVEGRLGDLERVLRRERLEKGKDGGNSHSKVEGESRPGEADSGA